MLPEIFNDGLDRAEGQLRAWDADVDALLPNLGPDEIKADIQSAITSWRRAESMVPWDPRPEVLSTVVAVADAYLSADTGARGRIRVAFARVPRVRQELFPLMGRCADRLVADGEVQWLRRGLAIAAISDGYPDWRDLYGALGYLYKAAMAAGVQPSAHFREVGALSSDHVLHWGSTREQIVEFESSAAFAEMMAKGAHVISDPAEGQPGES